MSAQTATANPQVPERALEPTAPPPTEPQGEEPQTALDPSPVDIRSAALSGLAIIAIVLLLRFAQAFVVPIVLGILMSYALDPLVGWLGQLRVPRPVAAALVLVALTAGAGWLIYGVRGEVSEIVEQLPESARRLRTAFETGRRAPGAAIAKVQTAANELEKAAAATAPAAAPPGVTRVQVEQPPLNISSYVVWGSLGAATAVGQVVLILFFVYFLLSSGDMYKRKMTKIVGTTLTEKKITVQILNEIDRQIATVLLTQVVASAAVAVATWVTFRALDVDQPAVWGILAGVVTSIPYFGPVIVGAGAALVGFVQFGTLHMAGVVGAAALAISAVEGLLVVPWITRGTARMNPVAVFVGLLFWGWLWNVWGLLLAVPMMLAVKAVCDRVEDFHAFGELLSD